MYSTPSLCAYLQCANYETGNFHCTPSLCAYLRHASYETGNFHCTPSLCAYLQGANNDYETGNVHCTPSLCAYLQGANYEVGSQLRKALIHSEALLCNRQTLTSPSDSVLCLIGI